MVAAASAEPAAASSAAVQPSEANSSCRSAGPAFRILQRFEQRASTSASGGRCCSSSDQRIAAPALRAARAASVSPELRFSDIASAAPARTRSRICRSTGVGSSKSKRSDARRLVSTQHAASDTPARARARRPARGGGRRRAGRRRRAARSAPWWRARRAAGAGARAAGAAATLSLGGSGVGAGAVDFHGRLRKDRRALVRNLELDADARDAVQGRSAWTDHRPSPPPISLVQHVAAHTLVHVRGAGVSFSNTPHTRGATTRRRRWWRRSPRAGVRQHMSSHARTLWHWEAVLRGEHWVQ